MGKPVSARIPHTTEMWQPRWLLTNPLLPVAGVIGLTVLRCVLSVGYGNRPLGLLIIIGTVAISTLAVYMLLRINRGRAIPLPLFIAGSYLYLFTVTAGTFAGSMVASPFSIGVNPFLTLVLLAVISCVVPIIALCRPRREGEVACCAVCGQKQESDPGHVCPKCGRHWNEPGGTVRGRVVYPMPFFWLLGAMMLIVIAVFVSVLLLPKFDRLSTAATVRLMGVEAAARALVYERGWSPELIEAIAAAARNDADFEALRSFIADVEPGSRHLLAPVVSTMLADPALSDQRFTKLVETISRNYALSNATPPPGPVRQFIVHIGPAFGIEHLSLAGGQIQIQRWVLPFAHPCVDAQTVELRHGHGTAPLSWPLHAPIDGAYAHITFTPCDVHPATTPTITVPLMLVAAPPPTNLHQPPSPPIINPDGTISPPPGALWTRTVNLTIPVTRAD